MYTDSTEVGREVCVLGTNSRAARGYDEKSNPTPLRSSAPSPAPLRFTLYRTSRT